VGLSVLLEKEDPVTQRPNSSEKDATPSGRVGQVDRKNHPEGKDII
jgi:hypothetical protein